MVDSGSGGGNARDELRVRRQRALSAAQHGAAHGRNHGIGHARLVHCHHLLGAQEVQVHCHTRHEIVLI